MTNMSATTQWAHFEEKLKHVDADIRYMGLNDLIAFVSVASTAATTSTAASAAAAAASKPSLPQTEEFSRRVLVPVLDCVLDSIGEVQTMAVRAISHLARAGVSLAHVQQMEERLLTTMCSTQADQAQHRELAALALKTLVTSIPPSNVAVSEGITARLMPKLLSVESPSHDIQLELIDMIIELVTRYGLPAAADASATLLSAIQQYLLALFSHSRVTVRKRAAVALGNVSVFFSDALFDASVEAVVAQVKSAMEASDLAALKTWIPALGFLSNSSGPRFGTHLSNIIHLLLECVGVADNDNIDDELNECCLQVLEIWTVKCPTELEPSVPAVTRLCLELVKYDPNYLVESGDDESSGSGADSMEEDDEDDDGTDDEDEMDFSDDDDISFKIRRASAKLLQALITAYPASLAQFYRSVAPALMKRTLEREEGVRLEVLATLTMLLGQVLFSRGESSGLPGTAVSSGRNSPANEVMSPSVGRKKRKSTKSDAPMDLDEASPLQILSTQLPTLCSSLSRALKHHFKHQLTVQAIFKLLRELIKTMGGDSTLASLFTPFWPLIINSLKNGGATALRVDALSLVSHVVSTLPVTDETLEHGPALIKAIALCVTDSYFKVVVDACNVAAVLAGKSATWKLDSNVIHSLFTPIYACASATTAEQEVKEASLACLATLAVNATAALADVLSTQILPLLLERLRNEVTRLAALRALTVIAKCEQCDVSVVVGDVMSELVQLLRQQQRSLRHSAVVLILELTERYSSSMTKSHFETLASELKPLLSDNDNIFLGIALQILAIALATGAQKAVYAETYPVLLDIVSSDAIATSGAMSALLQFAVALKRAEPKQFSKMAESLISKGLAKDGALSAASQVLAVLVADATAQQRAKVFGELLGSLNSTSVMQHRFALAALGEIGKLSMDLSTGGSSISLHEHPISLIMDDSAADELRRTAAIALGNMAVGNLGFYLPIITQHLSACTFNSRSHQLLLAALSQMISSTMAVEESKRATESPLAPYAMELWKSLISMCKAQTVSDLTGLDSIRMITAECLGKLAAADADAYLRDIQSCVESTSAFARACIVSTTRFLIADGARQSWCDAKLRQLLMLFFSLMACDDNFIVRSVSLNAFSVVLHVQPLLLLDDIPAVLELVYSQCKVREELVQIVDMGPFKHRIDKGLDSRKSAFECLFNLLDLNALHHRIDWPNFLAHALSSVHDPAQEIQSLSHWMIVKLSSIPHAVACLTNGKLLEDVSGALQAMLKVKLKETAVKQEIEKRAELVRSCLRALLALAKATGAMTVSDANDEIVLRPAANAKLVAVLRETLVTVGLGEQMKELAVDMKSA